MKIIYGIVFALLALVESLYIALCLEVTWFLWTLYIIIEDRNSGQKFLDEKGAENAWGFGQIMPVLLILLPIHTLGEIYIGKLNYFAYINDL